MSDRIVEGTSEQLLNQGRLVIEITFEASALVLYSKGRVLGFERAKRTQNPNVSLIQVEGVQTTKDVNSTSVNGSKIRVIWGRIARTHGTNGVVKARFRKNLPPKVFGASVRVMLYPSNI
ncbi:unnamed protein product [Mucor hiemalis]